MMRAEELSDLVNSTFSAENRDLTVIIMPEILVQIASELNVITITSESRPLLSNDISSSAIILDTILNIAIM